MNGHMAAALGVGSQTGVAGRTAFRDHREHRRPGELGRAPSPRKARVIGEAPDHAGLPWRIVIDCQTEPDPRTAARLDALVQPVAKYCGAVLRRALGEELRAADRP